MDNKIKCKQCGKEFTLTESEKDFYIKKGLQLPKRCKECREQNKQSNNSGLQKDQPQTANILAPLLNKPGGAVAVILTIIVIAVCAIFLLPNDTTDDNYSKQQDNSYTQASLPETKAETDAAPQIPETESKHYTFRNNDRLVEHYEKHGIEMGFASAEEYEQAANDVINDPDSLTKREAEDNDYVYFLEATNEFVVVSTDGYIRTYYYADFDYYNRQ